MLKKHIEYTDFNGAVRKEDHYFNLSKSELMKMEMGTTGGWSDWVKQIVNAQDVPTLMKVFEEVLRKSYGRKTLDGRGFEKSDAIWLEFYQSGAYDTLFMELLTDADAAQKFINGIIPEDMREAAAKDPALIAALNN